MKKYTLLAIIVVIIVIGTYLFISRNKIYRNDTFGFEFEYSNSFDEQGLGVQEMILMNNEDVKLLLQMQHSLNNEDTSQRTVSYISNDYLGKLDVHHTEFFELEDKWTVRYEFKDPLGYLYVLSTSIKGADFETSPITQEIRDIMEGILATLKFD